MSQDPRQNLPRALKQQPKKNATENKMETQDHRPATPDNIWSELASIKDMLWGIAADVSSMKTGLQRQQTTVEQLGVPVTEAETRTSDLEDASNSRGAIHGLRHIKLKNAPG